MSHEDQELSDVVVVLVDEPGMTFADAVKKLTDAGLSVTDTDESDGVVEGTIATAKLADLKKMEFVKYLRDVFNYIGEFPSAHGSNPNDDSANDLPSQADDAGA